MKSYFSITVSLIIGFLLGAVFAGVAINTSAASMMLTEIKSPLDHARTVAKISENIGLQAGWHVVSVIDQQEECLKHGGQNIGKFTIIKYCNGKISAEMLVTDDRKRMGAMMPKALAVYEKSDGQVYVSSANGAVMGKLFGGEVEKIIEKVSLEVESMLRFMNFKFTIF